VIGAVNRVYKCIRLIERTFVIILCIYFLSLTSPWRPIIFFLLCSCVVQSVVGRASVSLIYANLTRHWKRFYTSIGCYLIYRVGQNVVHFVSSRNENFVRNENENQILIFCASFENLRQNRKFNFRFSFRTKFSVWDETKNVQHFAPPCILQAITIIVLT